MAFLLVKFNRPNAKKETKRGRGGGTLKKKKNRERERDEEWRGEEERSCDPWKFKRTRISGILT